LADVISTAGLTRKPPAPATVTHPPTPTDTLLCVSAPPASVLRTNTGHEPIGRMSHAQHPAWNHR
jgi:hypothetical protein